MQWTALTGVVLSRWELRCRRQGFPDAFADESRFCDIWNFGGRTPKPLGFFAIFRFDRASRQLPRSSEGADASRRLFDGADTTGEIRFTSVWFQRKQSGVFCSPLVCRVLGDHRKRQSERRATRSGIYRTKRSSLVRKRQY